MHASLHVGTGIEDIKCGESTFFRLVFAFWGRFLYNVVGCRAGCRAVCTTYLALKHFLHTFIQFPDQKRVWSY